MFSLTKFIIFLTVFCIFAFAAPYQTLPPRPGYIPVYIREGNTPLSQVNPELVEAFHEYEHVIPKETETAFDVEIVVKNGEKEATAKLCTKLIEDEENINTNIVKNKVQIISNKN